MTQMTRIVIVGLVALLSGSLHARQPKPQVVEASRFAGIDRLMDAAIAAKQTPGGVVLVGRGDTVVVEKAYGHRALAPSVEVMTLDTIFDLASLITTVATTKAELQLVERGSVRRTG